jgi:hypothetical protein
LSRFVAIRKKPITSLAPRTHQTATQAPPHPGTTSPKRERPRPTILSCRHHLTQAPRYYHASAKGPPHCQADTTSLPRKHLGPTSLPRKRHLTQGMSSL